MSLQFIIGRAGAGKSYLLYQNMIEASRKDKNKNFVAVVPEQYSMEAQKEIMNMHPHKGSFNIEVTSLNRLAYTVFEEQGITSYKVMDDLGKTLVMRKVLEDCKQDLVIYKDKTSMPGFADKMKMVVSELQQYGIDAKKLQSMKKEVETRPALKHKLRDVEIINHAFHEYISEKMITSEDVLLQLCQQIPKSEYVANTYFYLDGFTGFTPIQYAVLELIIKHSAGVKVALTLPEEEQNFTTYNKFELFSLSKETISKLTEMAKQHNIKIENRIVAGENQNPYRIKDNKALCFLEENIFRNKKTESFREQCESVEIHICSNPVKEVEYVASKIASLVVEEGYRYNDLAVITGDVEGYYRYVEEIFEKYSIPAFVDHKRNISANPFVEGIRAAIEIVEKDFSYESVFHMLRLGFVDIDLETIDIMENYVLQSGRRGYKSYGTQWEKVYQGMDKESLVAINMGREKVYETMKPFRMALKNGKTVADYTKAVYDFVLSQNMQEKINEYAEMFRVGNQQSQQREYEQTYATIISVLDRIYALMGEETISLKDYKQILQAGFESVKVGIIPPGLDTVMVGDIERTRLKDTKKMIFFIGVNDGIIPGDGVSGGIITDSDREFLENKNYILAPTARENVFKQKFYLYSLMAKPTEKIIMSYSKSAPDGSVRRKSYLISNIQKLFKNISVADEETRESSFSDFTNKNAALCYLADHIYEYRLKSENKLFEQISSILLKDDTCKKTIELMTKGAFYSNDKGILHKEIARKLYGVKDNIGVTRLEKYAACAYSQFLKNGLRLGDRKKYEIAAFDIGNLYHDTINRFFVRVENDDIAWGKLTKDQSHKIVEDCVDKVMEEYENDALEGSARNLFIKEKVRETALKTTDILVKHIHSGKFVPAEYEVRVGQDRIDRVDVLNKENEIYVKVIDYKSGEKTFSISDTFLGLQIQLMVYLKDAMTYEKKKHQECNVLPAGGFYFHIHDPYVAKPDFEKVIRDYRKENPDSKLSDDEIKVMEIDKLRYKSYKMSGMVNADKDIIEAMDESLITNTGSSDILPVQTTKNGIGARSVVMDSDNYKRFIDHVSDVAENFKKEIFDGQIAMNPMEGACEYCPYGSVCGFDRKLGDRYREKEKLSLDMILETMNSDDAKKAEEVE